MSGVNTYEKALDVRARVQKMWGFVPNLIEEMVTAPAVAKVYLDGQETMAGASLDNRDEQAVQLAVAVFNDCHYCQAAHSAIAKGAGISVEDIEAITSGKLPSAQRLANVVKATRLVLAKKGWLSAEDLEALEADGIDRRQLYEIIALIGLKTISNYINHIAHTEIDPQFR